MVQLFRSSIISMGLSTLCYTVVLFFIVASCDSSDKKSIQHNGLDSTEQTAAYNDTTTGLKSTAQSSTQDTTNQSIAMKDTIPDLPPPPRPGPAPGHIRLEGKMVEVQKNDSSETVKLRFKVLKILGIGSATPTVVVNDTLTVFTHALSDSLKEGYRFITVLSSSPSMQLDDSSAESSEWQVVSLNKKKIDQ